MRVTRRAFVRSSAAALALSGDKSVSAQARGAGTGNPVPASIAALKPLPNPAPPITADERRARIAKAQRLMIEQGIGAIVLESGTSMAYFVNVRWGLSERPFLLVIPAKGDPAYISPGLEEQRAREVPHRTGHGIGMDGHEWPNFVKGEKTRNIPFQGDSDVP